MSTARMLLLCAGMMSLTASLLHLATIVGGPAWYRFFGAGEAIARAAERGSIAPALIACGIAAMLAIWAAYAFSAAGIVPRLPLLRTALVVICMILLARGLAIAAPGLWRPDLTLTFKLWSSAIVLVTGLCFSAGTWLSWRLLALQSQS